MKKVLFKAIQLLLLALLFTSCATIVGGGSYYAKVYVPGYPNAQIAHKGLIRGLGEANIKTERREANNFEVTVSYEGCETQSKTFTQRQFRGWAFVGTVVTWTGLTVNGGPWLPIPFGVILDGAVGSWWKPDIKEKGVSKQDLNNYTYRIDYTGCPSKEEGVPIISKPTKADMIRNMKQLLDDGIITPEEFENEKAKILEQG